MPLIDWVDLSPAFHLTEEKSEEVIKTLRPFFEVQNLYEAGSHMGCGCGFLYDEDDNNEDDFQERINSFNGLLNYLKKNIYSDIQVFYTSWDENVFNTKIKTSTFKLPQGEEKKMAFPENTVLNITL